MYSYHLAGQDDRHLSELLELPYFLRHLCDHALHHLWAERKVYPMIAVGQTCNDRLLQLRIQRHHSHAVALAELSRDGTLQCNTDILCDRIQIPDRHGRIHDRLHDSLHILDRNPFLQKIGQDLLEITVRDQLRNQLFHKLRRLPLHILYQAYYLRTVQEFMRMLLHRLGQMRQHNREGVDNRISVDLRHLLLIHRDPFTRNTICRLDGIYTINLLLKIRRLQRKIVIYQYLALGNLLALDLDHILIRIQAGAVTKPYRRNDKPHLLCILPAEDHDTVDHPAAAGLIHKRDQAVAEFHLDRLYR